MKRILYLDRDFMDSYIAQTRAGLPGQHVYTSANNTIDGQSVTHPSINYRISGSIHAGIPIISGDANYEQAVTTQTQKDVAFASDSAKEELTLIPHDNALDDVIQHSGATARDDIEIGSYILRTGNRPSIYDVKDITERLDDAAITYIAEKTADERINKLPNPAAKQVEQERKRIIREETKMLTDARRQLIMTCKFAQFDVCVVIGDVIAPLNREWMRTNTRDMIFKYDSRLKLFGQVTRVFTKTEKAPDLNPVETLNALFNGTWPEALQRMQIIPEDRYWVVDPMALYFE